MVKYHKLYVKYKFNHFSSEEMKKLLLKLGNDRELDAGNEKFQQTDSEVRKHINHKNEYCQAQLALLSAHPSVT